MIPKCPKCGRWESVGSRGFAGPGMPHISYYHCSRCDYGWQEGPTDLEKENMLLKARIKEIEDHISTRIQIEESRPPLSVGKPCPKCGQIVR